MNDETLSDVWSIFSDVSNLSDLDDQCKPFHFNFSNGSPISVNDFD